MKLNISILCFLTFLLLCIISFITADKNLVLTAYQGPLKFWLQFPWTFIVLAFAGFSVFLLIPKIEADNFAYVSAFFISIGTFVTKLLLPYYLFNQLVHYDIFSHYFNVKILSSEGLQPMYYLYWPNTFTLTSAFENATTLSFPLITSLLAIISAILLVILFFIFIKRLFGRKEAVLSILLLTLVTPVSIHYAPFTITLTLIILSFVLFYFGILRQNKLFLLLSMLVTTSSIFFHAFLPVILGIFVIISAFSLKFLSRFSNVKIVNRNYIAIGTSIFLGTFCYWLYVRYTVFRRILITVENAFFGGPTRFVTETTFSSIPEIANQLIFIGMLSKYTRYFLPLLVLIPVLIWGFFLMSKKKIDSKRVKIVSLAAIALSMAFMGFVLEFVVPFGFAGRFLHFFYMFLSILAAVCLLDLVMWKGVFRKKLYILFGLLFIVGIIISPITDTTDYADVHCRPLIDADGKTVAFLSTHLVQNQPVTGDCRFGLMIELVMWPTSVSYSNELIENIQHNIFEFDADLIVVNLATPNYVTVKGVNDLKATTYLAELPNNCNIYYSSGYDTIYG